jgi:hypothetical protein
VHVHDPAAMQRRCVCHRCLLAVVLILVKHHRVTWKETWFPGWTISGGAASAWLAHRSQVDELRRIDGKRFLTRSP